jgi:hypothetical protein
LFSQRFPRESRYSVAAADFARGARAAFAPRPGVGLETNIAAVVAALDLKVVRLLRDAIRTTEAAAHLAVSAAVDRFESRQVHEPEPRFEPRPVVHPTARFEPRPVIHPTPRVDSPNYPVVVVEVVAPCDESKSPIEPPWRVLPWEDTPASPAPAHVAQPARRVKPPIRRPDIVSKGSLIDFFC